MHFNVASERAEEREAEREKGTGEGGREGFSCGEIYKKPLRQVQAGHVTQNPPHSLPGSLFSLLPPLLLLPLLLWSPGP